ncbi:hypothetical protein Ait01nite_082350 [Actinoplanes italicus]|uniref:Uncharacterized protein n=1 Tax=Actinoplanes italicus TaxID=113567 RepID=A0A2T0K320_9ACTN|nr:hypothetical protein [Actinoplanes italicus]PRX17252.1 hypothetical protein CLV67_11628 [Actinoplanes italicus]GIE35190.1 hypothetical protein Ait01nite_082350 [Actinoplanes italicus]
MDLTLEQRDRIRRLLEDELREAYRHAIDRGASRAVVEQDAAGRRRALEAPARRIAAEDRGDEGSGFGRER